MLFSKRILPYKIPQNDNYATPELALRAAFKTAIEKKRFSEEDKNLVIEKYRLDRFDDLLLESHAKHLRDVMREAMLLDFYIFALYVNMPISNNDIYMDIIDKVYNNPTNGQYAVFIPRSCMKSSMLMLFGAFLYLRDVVIYKKHPRILVVHGNIDKSKENLSLLKAYLFGNAVQELFRTITKRISDNQTTLNLRDVVSGPPRKEATFTAVSTSSDLTGRHYTYILGDDLETAENSTTQARRQIVMNFYEQLQPLNDGTHSVLPLYLAGTRYTDDGFYEKYIFNKHTIFTVVNIPLSKKTKDGIESTFPDRITVEEIGKLKEAYRNNMSYYLSQYEMKPYSLSGELNFIMDSGMYPSPKEMAQKGLVYKAIVCDPAISQTGKSLAIALEVSFYSSGDITVDWEYSATAPKPSELVELLVDRAKTVNANAIVVEAIAYQQSLVIALTEKVLESRLGIQVIPHRHYVDKMVHIIGTLEPFFTGRRLAVSQQCKQLVSEIEAQKPSDALDALSFISSLNLNGIFQSPTPKEVQETIDRRQQSSKQSYFGL